MVIVSPSLSIFLDRESRDPVEIRPRDTDTIQSVRARANECAHRASSDRVESNNERAFAGCAPSGRSLDRATAHGRARERSRRRSRRRRERHGVRSRRVAREGGMLRMVQMDNGLNR